MTEEISLLPEEQRKKEDQIKKTEAPSPKSSSSSDLRFSTPITDGEDVEVIEIDEGEVDQILANEPPLTRMLYKVENFFEELKHKLFEPHEPEPAPKLPPQFFVAPPAKPKPVTPVVPATPVAPPAAATGSAKLSPQAAGAALLSEVVPGLQKPVVKPEGSVVASATNANITAGPIKAKPRIVPVEKTPKRVRVIRRVRKPVRVSFVSDESLHAMHIDVPKRKFTLVVLSTLFIVVLAGGWFVLNTQQAAADVQLTSAQSQVAAVVSATKAKQKE